MLFNSYKFFIFLFVVLCLFYALPHRFRWLFLLASSYFYYMFWDPRYAILISVTTVVVYGTALAMKGRTAGVRKLLVALSAFLNLGILFIFKYYNFFSSTLHSIFSNFGLNYQVPTLSLLMPIGISFYTFMALSYTIDVYRGTREPERNLGLFALYLSFFPILLSGPIERSTTLLPQFDKEIKFDYNNFTDGLKLFAWGYFQKLVIADRLSIYVNQIFATPQAFHGLPVLLALYLFTFQVFCDFSGYTDMAIGAGQMLGYRLIPNFRRPHFAQSLAELWRRWHMSLISWFRDYLYIPLGGNRVPQWRSYINMLIIFTLSGLWHGAQWTFVIWGSLNGVFLVLSRMTQEWRDWIHRKVMEGLARVPAAGYFASGALLAAAAFMVGRIGMPGGIGTRVLCGAAALMALVLGAFKTRGAAFDRFIKGVRVFWMRFVTVTLLMIGGVFFGSKTLSDAWYIMTHSFGTNFKDLLLNQHPFQFAMTILVVIVLIVIQYIQETRGSLRELVRARPAWFRWSLYFLLCCGILMLGYRGSTQFIYFRF